MAMSQFLHYHLQLLNPRFDSPLLDVLTDLEHLRRLEIRGSTPPPVFLQLKLDDYMTELPEEARQMASQAMDGFQGASFGNEEELNTLVDEICAFVLGKPPSRQPGKTEIPLIAGGEVKDNA